MQHFLTSGDDRAIVIVEAERKPSMKDVKRILAICRMVTHCGEVVHYGTTLARQFRAELFVMNVIYDPFGIKGWNLPLPSLAEDYRKLLEKTRKDLHDIIAQEKQQGIAVKELIREGKPVEEILKVIREQKIDLLVLPAHEETMLEHFLFGRDNEDLIRKMPCSILFVKSEPGPVIEKEEQEGEETEQE
jgi:nucleotide-binding universal stress UspA family protein